MDQRRSISTPPSGASYRPYIGTESPQSPTTDSDSSGFDPDINSIQENGSSTTIVSAAAPTTATAATTLSDASTLSVYSHSQETPTQKKTAPELSTLRLLFAHIGAALTLFLATTDATIVSTSLPTITSELEATNAQYTWVGVAYLLTQCAFQPLYGKISDLVGRMNLLYASIAIFALGSLLCGISQSINMLIASRALAGIGGGGIVSCVWVITTEIVQSRHRAKWSQALSLTWSCSAVAGPLLGGLFSGGPTSFVNWRWCFYLNLPLCLVGFLILSVTLHGVQLSSSRQTDASYSLLKRFDFIGLTMFMAGTCCIVVGFSFATGNGGWKSPSTIVLIILGLIILVFGSLYETYTTRDSLFPPTIFKSRTAVTVLVIAFLHNFAFNAGTFYLALFYQAADGYTPLEAGIKMLPYSLGASLASMPTAWFITYWQKRKRDTSGQNLVISVGFLISTIGFALLILLNENSRMVFQHLFPLVAGIGLGILFHAPYQVFAKSFKPSELATCTSAFFLVRFTGATVGIAVAGAVFDARLTSRITSSMGLEDVGSSFDYSTLRSMQPPSLQAEILHIVSTSFQAVWIVCTPLLGVALIMSFLLQKYPIEEEDEKNATTENNEQSPAEANV
ncbi:major facilitator superfamily domain-containing protein [Rhodocollybia butyracea]|uniref:Major facilitator superfamily domain-containing protein n=1 Tax=Rhodocollybia butyracea TaxID=206335 RepID=A0A9P5UC70_9AGAR|nr:major facilitator superfamily domain-containing protein [Rhodocollybia butyracea]